MSSISIHIEGDKRVQKKIVGFHRGMPNQLRKGFTKAGVILGNEWGNVLNNQSHSRGGTSKYPGVVSGHLRKAQSKVSDSAGNVQLRVGASSLAKKYAPVQALGATIRPKTGKYLRFQIGKNWVTVKQVVIPARDWRQAVIKNAGSKAVRAIEKTVMEGWAT